MGFINKFITFGGHHLVYSAIRVGFALAPRFWPRLAVQNRSGLSPGGVHEELQRKGQRKAPLQLHRGTQALCDTRTMTGTYGNDDGDDGNRCTGKGP